MGEDMFAGLVAAPESGVVERECSWCEAAVPLPAGELVGVCISCGTLVFRNELDSRRAARRGMARRLQDVPTPA